MTGSSGSGMWSATNAFQDLGYFCVDNPGVRGAWVIQVGALYWCRVYSHEEDGQLRSTAGRAFGFDPQFGWVVNEGLQTVMESEAIWMRAERAAFYLVVRISEQIRAGAWRAITKRTTHEASVWRSTREDL